MIMRKLTFTRLRDVTASVGIFYDPHLDTTLIEEDKAFVDAFFAIPDEDIRLELQSPWLLRLELDRAKVLEGGHEMADIVNAIAETVGKDRLCDSFGRQTRPSSSSESGPWPRRRTRS